MNLKLATALAEEASAGVALPVANEEKRNWQALQGPWGKRAHYNEHTLPESSEPEDDERLVPLLISNGERDEPFLKFSMMYLTNAGTLDRLLNDRQEEPSGMRMSDDLITSFEDNDGFANANDDHDNLLNEKRAWNKINAAWGKRRNAPTWNKFRGEVFELLKYYLFLFQNAFLCISIPVGAWGKREPGWNNLKGMWGKRSSKDWAKLHGGWGKRSLN